MPLTPDIQEYWDGLASFGVVAIRLFPGTKIPAKDWGHFIGLHEQHGRTRLDLVHQWLRKGYGVGYLPRGGLYAIDCDIPAGAVAPPMESRLEDYFSHNWQTCPVLQTPSGGLHYHLCLPPSIDQGRLKNHICHPVLDDERQPWDWKLFERTMLVGPGTTVVKNGQTKVYTPRTPWTEPPVIDPRSIEPNLDLYRPESLPFLKDERPLGQRTARAVQYLKTSAPIAISGKGGRTALRRVAEYLVAFLDLDPGLAYWLLTNPTVTGGCWNSRCKDISGRPAPWSGRELYGALENAIDALPSIGAWAYLEAEANAKIRGAYQGFTDLLSFLPTIQPATPPWMYAGDLFAEFIRIYNFDPDHFSQEEFGRRLNAAIEGGVVNLQRSLKGKARLAAYKGVSPELIAIALLRQGEAKQTRPHAS